ncbi:hypothetical protein HDU88_003311 [Geranomyces variabilis]|nr:hypothetical protein HDU88_003311 [Geranomyces variabilis]
MIAVRNVSTECSAVMEAAEAGIEHDHIAAEAALAASALKSAAPSNRDDDKETRRPLRSGPARVVKRKKANDTRLPSGVTLEQLLLKQAMRTETETLAHSWIVDLGEDWLAELVPTDRGALVDLAQERAFSCGKLDRNIDAFMQSEDVYRRCEAQPQEGLWMALATRPDFRLDEGKDAARHQKLFELRAVLKFVIATWAKEGRTRSTMKSECFRSTGMHSMSWCPKGSELWTQKRHKRPAKTGSCSPTETPTTFAFGRSSHLIETFAATWLVLTRIQGLPRLSQVLRYMLAFNDTLHAVSRALAEAPSGRPAERHLLSAVTPKSATKNR